MRAVLQNLVIYKVYFQKYGNKYMYALGLWLQQYARSHLFGEGLV